MLLTNQNSPGSSDGQDNLVGVNVLVGLFADLLTARLNVIGQLLYDLKHSNSLASPLQSSGSW